MMNSQEVLLSFWKKLSHVTSFTFHAKAESQNGFERRGEGTVTLEKRAETVLIFHEKGIWKELQGKETGFTSVLSWTLDNKNSVIFLSHLRRGQDNPVLLLELSPKSESLLVSRECHLCGQDTYVGQVFQSQHELQLSWQVLGPKKNEEITICYF